MIGGLFTDYAMSSIAIMVFTGFVLLDAPRQTFRRFFADRVLVALSLLFFLYVFSALNSTQDRQFLLERIRIKLPFLALPFCFAYLKYRLPAQQVYALLYLFVLLATITALRILVNMSRHADSVVQQYLQGQIPDTPFHHTRYSLMLALAVFAAAYLWQQRYVLRYGLERPLLLLAALFLFLFLHFLAVRSGLVAFYLCLFFLLLQALWLRKQTILSLIGLLLMALAPLLAYQLVPTFRAKVQYMIHDLKGTYRNADNTHYSDGGRIASIIAGWHLFTENWLTGTGIGDLRVEMKNIMNADHPEGRWLLPHNQFVFVAAGTGIFGLLLLLTAITLPLWPQASRRNWLYVCLNIILISSFFYEATLEEQIGTIFYLVFVLMGYICLNSSTE